MSETRGRYTCPIDPNLEAVLSGNFDPCESFVLERYDIPPGETVELTSEECVKEHVHPVPWMEGTRFFPARLVYVGSPYIWILSAHTNMQHAFGMSLPMDSYRPGTPHSIAWPPFAPQEQALSLRIQNRGREKGNFIARLAGMYYFPGRELPRRRSLWP